MSNVKRKDNKGRNLRLGESQRKDGRYVYKYTDIYGKPQFKYAWKLVPTDKTPAGKREDLSLREKEKKIKKDLADGFNTGVRWRDASLPALREEEQPEKKCETQHRKRSPVSYENSGKRPSGCKEH